MLLQQINPLSSQHPYSMGTSASLWQRYGPNTDNKLTVAAIGLDYSLAKKSKAFTYVAQRNINEGSSQQKSNTVTAAIGFEHSF